MFKVSKAGVFASLAMGLTVIFALVDHESVFASENNEPVGYYIAHQEENIQELNQVKAQLVAYGEEGSDLYLAVQNAIDTSQRLIDEAKGWPPFSQ